MSGNGRVPYCDECNDTGDCDHCDSIDGRWIEAVCEYASTCDGCGELEMHSAMEMDPVTHLGYCARCVPQLTPDIRRRLGGPLQ